MTDFNDLGEAGASQNGDQFAIARGGSTLRQAIARIVSEARAGVALLGGAVFTGHVSGIAPAAAAHFTRLDFVEALSPEVWAEIANGTTIPVKKIVTHGGLYFGCITQHNKGATGPDGDPANWVPLTNYGGAWTDKWWPRGVFVTHAGYVYVATAVIRAGSPQPNAATNVLWQLLGTIPAGVVSYNVNTIITEAQRGFAFRATGAVTRLLSLPNASGAGEVPNGWDVVVANGSTADQTVRPNGADTVGGNASLTLAAGRNVRLLKVATGAWIIIADTKDETGGGGAVFVPSQANLYEAVKAIFTHNTAVSADDANMELDFASGAAGALDDNSIAPVKLLAERPVDKKSMRLRIGAVSVVGVANALPAVADHNVNDLAIIWRGGATVVPFRELADPTTEITQTVAGDLIQLYPAGWTRVSNLFSGGIAAAAAQAAAEAADAKAVAAQLTGDTVITLNKPLIAGLVTGQNLDFSIEHPIGSYPGANAIAIELRGRTYYGNTAYNPNLPRQTIQVGLDSAVLTNLNDNGALDAGDFVWAIVRFQTGTNSASAAFRRNINIPVVARTPARFETAVGASPAVLPVGTHELAVLLRVGSVGDNEFAEQRVLISNVPAADRIFFARGDGAAEAGVRMRYTAATRTLTYAGARTAEQGAFIGIKAIGAA